MKKTATNPDRNDPKTNKSLAIRTILTSAPDMKTADVITNAYALYKQELTPNMVYMVKAKMSSNGKTKSKTADSSINIPAIQSAVQLVKLCGSVSTAVQVLKAVSDEV